jgi:phosphatidate cytidylyltransferase
VSAGSGLLTRVGTALILLPVVLALIWVPGWDLGLAAFVAVIAAVAVFEFGQLARRKHIAFPTGLVTAGAIAANVAGYHGDTFLSATIILLGILAISAWELRAGHDALAGMGAAAFALVYIGWTASHVPLMHATPEIGPGLVMLLLVAVAATDTGAYFVGKNLGRRKMAPVISPNKTWEGAAGGLLFPVLLFVAIAVLAEREGWSVFPDWSLPRFGATAAALSVAAQIGDLVESKLKRDAGVKDSGGIFPGHGGALDRCDGFLFAAPLLYYMARL